MGKVISWPFKIAGAIGFAVFGLWGLILSTVIINEVAGFVGVVVGFLLLPVMYIAVPWYALAAQGNFLPLLVNYGGFLLVAILFGIAHLISGSYWD